VTLCLCGNRILHETQHATAGLGSTAVLGVCLSVSLKLCPTVRRLSAACGILGLHVLHQLALLSERGGAAVGCNWVLGCGS